MKIKVTLRSHFDFEKPLPDLISELQALLAHVDPKLSNPQFESNGISDGYETGYQYDLVADREETPEEEQKRLGVAKEAAERQKEYVRQQAIRLGLIPES
jgi:hypothetical protein